MRKLEIYDGKKTYMYPNSEVATPERLEKDYPAIKVFPHVIEVNGNTLGAVMELEALKGMYDIDGSLNDVDAVKEIEKIINTPVEVPPSAEERIAAAMEFQNLINL